MDNKSYFKADGDFIYFTGSYMEAYVPASFEDSKLFSDLGDSVDVFGLLNIRVFDNNGKPGKLKTLNLPTRVYLYPADITRQNLRLIEDFDEENDEDKYIVLKFYNGDKFIQKNVRQDATNVEMFLRLLTSGKVPATVPYKSVLETWHKNLSLNGVNLGVPSVVLEVIISQVYRYKKNPSYRFGIAQGKDPSISDYYYRAANMREVCSRSSVFGAITFEDFDAMATSSLNMTNYGKKQVESPIEKIIKM